jgi:hypothetical protein
MRATKENGEILLAYVKLARKLGKLPSQRETVRFVCSAEKIRNHFDGSFNNLKELALEKYPELQDILIPSKVVFDDLNDYKLELEKKNIDKKNKISLNNLLTVDALSRFVDTIYTGRIKPYKANSQKKPTTRALNLVLSDLHFGADIKSEETGYLNFGAVEESRRFAEVIKQTIDYKPHYRSVTELHVNLLGDIIQHKLHDAQDAAPVSEQISRAIHLLGQGLAQLGEAFGSVKVYCATGNHGRDLNRHHSRATSGKWDSVETVIYFAIKKILQDYKNITFIIPKTPYVTYDVFGHKVFSTHGDNVLKVGNPGKNLNIASVENQINRINASMNDKEEIKVCIVGHTHCASVSNLNSGCVMITNGALPPVDQYTVSIGYTENRASQTIFESTSEHAVGDVRFIRVGKSTDEDKRLDLIVKPFGGFND